MKEPSDTYQIYLDSIWRVQLHIEKHLDEKLSLDTLAKIAHFSPYHFHRIFRAFTNESLNGYIQRLRMEKAASSLKYKESSVTEIALDSGYQTPSSFSRVFSKMMGKTPRSYRSNCDGKPIDQPKKEINMIKPQIEEMTDQTVLSVRGNGSYQKSPEKAWKTLIKFAHKQNLKLDDAKKFGLTLDNPEITEEKHLRYDACISAPDAHIEKGDIRRTVVKGGKFAVFMHKGPYQKLEDSFDEIYKLWYPDHSKEVAERAPFCEYLNMELMDSQPENLLTKIYIPLI